jgi:hypothetical protein
MPSTPHTWPKSYLLSILAAAVEHGFLYLEPLSPVAAASLRASLIRVRRRADKSAAAYIIPEYYLVSVGQWEATGEDPDIGRLPVMYDALPEGLVLPKITPAERSVSLPTPVQQETPAPFAAEELAMEPAEIKSFVDSMKKRILKT